MDMKVSMLGNIIVNRCVPFLKRVCASLIPIRMVGHFRLVLAYGDNQKGRFDIAAALFRTRVSKPSRQRLKSTIHLEVLLPSVKAFTAR